MHQPLPTSGPWTAIIRANWDPTTNYNNAGLMVYSDDANFIKAGMVWSGGRRFEAFKELNNTPTGLGAATGVLPAAFPSTWYLRLQSDGNTIQPAYSADGQTWTNYGATTNLSGLTAPKIGVYATSASTVNREFKVDYFKLTTPQTPDDEFEGDVAEPLPLDGHRPPRAGRLHRRRREADAARGARRLLRQRAPTPTRTSCCRRRRPGRSRWRRGSRSTRTRTTSRPACWCTGTTRTTSRPTTCSPGNRALEFLRETNNTAAGFDGTVNIAARPTTVDLRIVSDGTTLRAYYRFDGDPGWTLFGEPAPLAGVGREPEDRRLRQRQQRDRDHA